MIRVVVADDSPSIREGLSSVLSAQKDIEVVATAQDGIEAVSHAQGFNPDVIVMDTNMPKLDGIEATRQIKQIEPSIGVLIFSALADSIREGVSAGADAFLSKDSDTDELINKIREVALRVGR